MQKTLLGLAGLSLSLMIGSQAAIAKEASTDAEAALLVYKVWEQGAEAYISRVLVTDTFVRLDEGVEGEGFTLFNRKEKVIYNISDEDHSILVIKPRLTEIKDNAMLLLTEKITEDAEAPSVGGVKPKSIELLANAESCAKIVAVKGLMPKAIAGLREFKQVLALVQADTAETRPEELQTPCDIATNISAPTRAFEYGLPLSEETEGRRQMLVDFKAEQTAPNRLFVIPTSYETMLMPTLPKL